MPFINWEGNTEEMRNKYDEPVNNHAENDSLCTLSLASKMSY